MRTHVAHTSHSHTHTSHTHTRCWFRLSAGLWKNSMADVHRTWKYIWKRIQLMGLEDVTDYDPNLLSDPQWPCGKHKRVLIFASYMTTVIEYVKPSDLKKDMNETFKEKFPHIKLTLSKIRSLKREMRVVGEDCGMQPVTIAMALVYFEKLVLQGRLNKQNRKLVSAACILLAAKISSDLKKQEVKHLIDKLEERFRISRRELISFEFTILVALEMALYLPESKVMPHYRKLVQLQQSKQ
uniref:Cdk5 and Abl enzyme substrate 2b n=1 Tax=Gasterosteus aculeatus aculeatus TaxID=481459 RepID=A0AAQ4P4U8_GASAC